MEKPQTIEEWNAYAAKVRTMQGTPLKTVPKHNSVKNHKRISSTNSLPLYSLKQSKKGKSFLKQVLRGKRGTRVSEEFTCQCCNKTFSTGWRYIVDDSRIYLCNKCKIGIKPEYIKILYTPMK